SLTYLPTLTHHSPTPPIYTLSLHDALPISNLKNRLRHTSLSARRKKSNSRSLRMKNRRTYPNQSNRYQNPSIARSIRQNGNPNSREKHSDKLCIRLRVFVCISTNDRLENRSRKLKTKSDDPDLPHRQVISLFQLWIHSRNNRL